jgi:hypothetical protein
MAKGRQLVNTLGELAAQYGITKPVLYGLIDQYEDLAKKIQPFKDGNKKIYPPAIIDEIKKVLGEP